MSHALNRGEPGQVVVCVLGMHRSGTSVLTRMLNLLGVELGPEDKLLAPDDYNETGFWEHEGMVALNDDLLAACGGAWQEPPPLPSGWEDAPELEELRLRARTLVAEDFGEVGLWGWKDPRTCVTLPFWTQVLPPMRYVVCVRNPLAVAGSLERVDFPVARSVDLWVRYTASALAHTSALPRLLVAYEDVMEDWERELERLAAFLGSPELARQPAIREAVAAYVEPELFHHRVGIDDALADPRVDFPAKALYASLQEPTPESGLLDALAIAAQQAQDDLVRLREESDAGERASRDYATLLRRYEDLVSRHETVVADRRARAANEERLQARIAELEEQPRREADVIPTPDEQPHSVETRPEREGLVAQVQALVEAAIPKGAAVLVSGLGEALPRELTSVRPSAFPGTGMQPESGTEAVAELETLYAGGARYLILAGPALAWLDDLAALQQYLDARARTVAREETCAVFALGEAASGEVDAVRGRLVADELASFADALLPSGAQVVVASDEEKVDRELERLTAAGAEYVLVPTRVSAGPDRYSELRKMLGARLVARRANLGEVYDVRASRLRGSRGDVDSER